MIMLLLGWAELGSHPEQLLSLKGLVTWPKWRLKIVQMALFGLLYLKTNECLVTSWVMGRGVFITLVFRALSEWFSGGEMSHCPCHGQQTTSVPTLCWHGRKWFIRYFVFYFLFIVTGLLLIFQRTKSLFSCLKEAYMPFHELFMPDLFFRI